jgi:hypothetical protein
MPKGVRKFAGGRNCLNTFLIFKSFKGALFVIIGQPPARFDTKKWSAITVACLASPETALTDRLSL